MAEKKKMAESLSFPHKSRPLPTIWVSGDCFGWREGVEQSRGWTAGERGESEESRDNSECVEGRGGPGREQAQPREHREIDPRWGPQMPLFKRRESGSIRERYEFRDVLGTGAFSKVGLPLSASCTLPSFPLMPNIQPSALFALFN